MKLEMLGVGSAYSHHWNNSALLIHAFDQHWLIDCGPSIPAAYWSKYPDIEALDFIYFTHIHPDHCMGLPVLLNWLHSHRRQRSLTIMAQAEQLESLQTLASFAHQEENKLHFEINWKTTLPTGIWNDWQFATAASYHPVSNRSLWLNTGKQRIFYSGDGKPTTETIKLMRQSDLIIHECGSVMPLGNHSAHSHLQGLEQIAESITNASWWLYHCPDDNRPQLQAAIANKPAWDLAPQGIINW